MSTQVDAWAAAQPTPPAPDILAAVEAIVAPLAAEWGKVIGLYPLFAGEAGFRNIATPGQVAVPHGGWLLVERSGWAGNGATGYLDGFGVATALPWTDDDHCLAVYSNSNYPAEGTFGARLGGIPTRWLGFRNRKPSTDRLNWWPATQDALYRELATSVGFRAMVRTGSTGGYVVVDDAVTPWETPGIGLPAAHIALGKLHTGWDPNVYSVALLARGTISQAALLDFGDAVRDVLEGFGTLFPAPVEMPIGPSCWAQAQIADVRPAGIAVYRYGAPAASDATPGTEFPRYVQSYTNCSAGPSLAASTQTQSGVFARKWMMHARGFAGRPNKLDMLDSAKRQCGMIFETVEDSDTANILDLMALRGRPLGEILDRAAARGWSADRVITWDYAQAYADTVFTISHLNVRACVGKVVLARHPITFIPGAVRRGVHLDAEMKDGRTGAQWLRLLQEFDCQLAVDGLKMVIGNDGIEAPFDDLSAPAVMALPSVMWIGVRAPRTEMVDGLRVPFNPANLEAEIDRQEAPFGCRLDRSKLMMTITLGPRGQTITPELCAEANRIAAERGYGCLYSFPGFSPTGGGASEPWNLALRAFWGIA